MKKVQVGIEVRDRLYAAEATLETALADSERLLARMRTAREELGLTGTVGEAAIARVADSVEALQAAHAAQAAGHEELAILMKTLDVSIRTKGKAPGSIGSYENRVA